MPNPKAIILLDVDAFYVQLLTKKFPEYANLPSVVMDQRVISSVSYEARKLGITRLMPLEKAKSLCPDLIHKQPQDFFDPLDPRREVRLAEWNIHNVVKEYVATELGLTENSIEMTACDELYIDVSVPAVQRANACVNIIDSTPSIPNPAPKIYFENQDACTLLSTSEYPDDLNSKVLYHAGLIAQRICNRLLEDPRTKFVFSGGVGTNKLMAKLACGLHRPKAITVLTPEGLGRVASLINIQDIPELGGARGKLIKTELNVQTMKDLQHVSETALENVLKSSKFTKLAKNLSFGIDTSPVSPVALSTGVLCKKNFEPEDCPVMSTTQVTDVIRLLSQRMEIRLTEEEERHGRKPLNLKLGIKPGGVAELKIKFKSDEIFDSAMGVLSEVYNEEKNLGIKEIYLAVKKLSVPTS